MKFFISGGGTGGHFFPALALIDCMMEKNMDVWFVGSKRGIEYGIKGQIPCPSMFLDVHPFVGMSLFKKARAILSLSVGTLKLIGNVKGAVGGVAFGGYASLSVGLALSIRGKRLYLHEQNSIPSFTNILLSKFSKKVFITFEHSRKFFPKEKVVKTGLQVRKDVLKHLSLSKEEARERLGLEGNNTTVLVMGGSQGAKFLNDLAMEFFQHFPVQGIHITGNKDYARVESYYAEKNLPVRVLPFTHQMGIVYRACDISISRAGAGTITELSLFGVPSLLIPYPFSARDHQFYNAKEIEELGGGRVMVQEEVSLEKVIKTVEYIMTEWGAFSKNIKTFYNPYACEKIIKEVLS
ncbi:MAG: undecaprenyldiphospho-muramoylpentapeptide beta-N-acetylglucosaminyltransferase [Aquificaceae bacterium]